MATKADVRAIALSLPGTTEEQWYQTPGYKVAGADLESRRLLHHPALRRMAQSCW
jgi:hypothetical protein